MQLQLASRRESKLESARSGGRIRADDFRVSRLEDSGVCGADQHLDRPWTQAIAAKANGVHSCRIRCCGTSICLVSTVVICIERNRVAREIHDTLAQGLAATSVQLRLAKRQANGSSQNLEHHLDVAQQLVRGSLQEARNSIWNMRSQVLEIGDLSDALKGILHQMADGTELQVTFKATGKVRRLAPVVETNVLRVGQEAITNAYRHSGAKQIEVELLFGEKRLDLVVKDDGAGFNTSKPPASSGGFGLVGMRERAAELQGELKITSSPGQGTAINLVVPLPGD